MLFQVVAACFGRLAGMTDLSAGEIVEAKKALSREMSLEVCLVVALNTNASRGVARARVALAEVAFAELDADRNPADMIKGQTSAGLAKHS